MYLHGVRVRERKREREGGREREGERERERERDRESGREGGRETQKKKNTSEVLLIATSQLQVATRSRFSASLVPSLARETSVDVSCFNTGSSSDVHW